ncbi:hypothetical protein [Corynebacterium hindlerae]|uniref:hypothetical protein n=1 Tax=Corynebacterium hindlerae TaxID=699041 RepID=UPI003AAEADE5
MSMFFISPSREHRQSTIGITTRRSIHLEKHPRAALFPRFDDVAMTMIPGCRCFSLTHPGNIVKPLSASPPAAAPTWKNTPGLRCFPALTMLQ